MIFRKPKVEDVLPEEPMEFELPTEQEKFQERLSRETERIRGELKQEKREKFKKDVSESIGKVTSGISKRTFTPSQKRFLFKAKKALKTGKVGKTKKDKTKTVSMGRVPTVQELLGVKQKPKGIVNPLQPNIDSLIFPNGAPQFYKKEVMDISNSTSGGKILKQKNLFWK